MNVRVVVAPLARGSVPGPHRDPRDPRDLCPLLAAGETDMAGIEEDVFDLPAGEDDNDSDRDEDERLFAWMVNDDMDEEEEEQEEEEVEDEELLDFESSELFELDTPAERSGHIAVIDRNIMYVWGGYKVRGVLDTCPEIVGYAIISYVILLCTFI